MVTSRKQQRVSDCRPSWRSWVRAVAVDMYFALNNIFRCIVHIYILYIYIFIDMSN